MEQLLPKEIEARSFALIREELSTLGPKVDAGNEDVILRAIHASADFEYASTLRFSPLAVETARSFLMNGADIVTDTNMALAGINRKRLLQFGGEAHCFMADEDVQSEAAARGVTRAYVSMERASRIEKPVIFAIGNAPTALIRLHELMTEGTYRPAFVIGVPVGFVHVVEAKELFLNSDVPFIVNAGRKGGSTIAAAIVNALLYGIPAREEAP